ncbi:hypothetical protein SAMD00019534_030580 [Acytostelium subglobosum LB1]|uniref:hypothetical protein n=1 Tax=Acytostelium subglobosum LB1 TaxID=1410327 RepID=UPI000644C759|nr:hypothetical protein SAMD00019534_030580 [Acytostelium subglobosum LB1]GAM19883.1 hypothetical protein SAMD00019534_030580 [Acytostelium subglobosum LB1]|eukprot:XP_012756645.1 hypothetical protein SAMD00019534_030580 [Acytostelium subglobosum LB1]
MSNKLISLLLLSVLLLVSVLAEADRSPAPTIAPEPEHAYYTVNIAAGEKGDVYHLSKVNNPGQVLSASSLDLPHTANLSDIHSHSASYVLRGSISTESNDRFKVANFYKVARYPNSYNPSDPEEERTGNFYHVQGAGFGPCKSLNCSVALNELNSDKRIMLKNITSPYTGLLIDRIWIDFILFELEKGSKALVQATVNDKNEAAITGLFINLPDPTRGCPKYKMAACPAGQKRWYSRSPNRCLVPKECIPQAPCPLYVPHCPEGYTLTSYPGKNSCPKYWCDPSFVTRIGTSY